MTFIKKIIDRIENNHLGKLFLDKKFLHYTWIGIFVSLLNIFLLWLFIDIWGIPTVASSTIVIGATFVIRYVLFRRFEAL
jgi:putative flippase GtrA